MSAADNLKPPRPCTEYNIFFQLERAYVLQVFLQTEPAIDDESEVFHPSQASYSGLPPLPRRYASLVLPYDWHLPGKEQRRKRKHRKTHGAIGFHDLSNRIANAWKAVDAEVKAYCSQVSAVGMARYKVAIKEWKRNGGEKQMVPHKPHREMKAKAIRHEESAQEPEELNSLDNSAKKTENTSIDLDFEALLLDLAQNDVPFPTPVLPQEVTSGEISQVFENDCILVGEGEVEDMWDVQVELLALEPTSLVGNGVFVPPNAVGIHGQDGSTMLNDNQAEDEVVRNTSVVSNETVDIDDDEIIRMWNTCDDAASNRQSPCDCTPVISASSTFKTASVQSANNSKTGQYDALFGLKGCTQTIQDMQRMKMLLDGQFAQLAKAKQPARHCPVVARCA